MFRTWRTAMSNDQISCCGCYCGCHIRAVYESMMYSNSFLSVSLHRFLSECISLPLSLCERISSPLIFYECISPPLSLFRLIQLVLFILIVLFSLDLPSTALALLYWCLINRFDTYAMVSLSLLCLDYPVPRHYYKSSHLTLSLFNYTLGWMGYSRPHL